MLGGNFNYMRGEPQNNHKTSGMMFGDMDVIFLELFEKLECAWDTLSSVSPKMFRNDISNISKVYKETFFITSSTILER